MRNLRIQPQIAVVVPVEAASMCTLRIVAAPLMALLLLFSLSHSNALAETSSPSAEPTLRRLDLIDLIRRRDFDTLDHRLDGAEAHWGRHWHLFANSDPALEADLTAWIEARPNSPIPLLARAQFYQHTGYLNHGTKWVRLTHPGQFAGMARLLRLAAADFTAALALNPRIGPAYAALVNIAVTTGDEESAIRLRQAGLAEVPDSAAVHQAYLRDLEPRWGGSWEQLNAYVDDLRAKYRDNPDFAFLNGYVDAAMADSLRANGDNADALQYAVKAILSHDTNGRRITHAWIRQNLKDYEAALEQVDKAIELAPDMGDYYYTRARILFELERHDDAYLDLDHAVALDPFDPDLLVGRARSLHRRADTAGNAGDANQRADLLRRAEADLTNALVHGSFDADVQVALARYHARPDGDSETAYGYYERAIALQPNNPYYWAAFVDALLSKQDCRAAEAVNQYLKVCKAARECEPNRAFSHYLQHQMPACLVQSIPEGAPLPLAPTMSDVTERLVVCGAFFGVQSDDTAVRACLDRARDGDPAAQFDMGQLYLNSAQLLMVQNAEAPHVALAVEWFRKAEAQDYADATAFLGQIHVLGFGVPRDVEKGLSMMRSAAEKDSIVALNALGHFHFYGLPTGLAPDKDQARTYYRRARELGSDEASSALRTLFDDHG